MNKDNIGNLAITILISTVLISVGVGMVTNHTGWGLIAGGVCFVLGEIIFGLIQRWK